MTNFALHFHSKKIFKVREDQTKDQSGSRDSFTI